MLSNCSNYTHLLDCVVWDSFLERFLANTSFTLMLALKTGCEHTAETDNNLLVG